MVSSYDILVSKGYTPAEVLRIFSHTEGAADVQKVLDSPYDQHLSYLEITSGNGGFSPPIGPVGVPSLPPVPGGTVTAPVYVLNSIDDIIVFTEQNPGANLADYIRRGALKIAGMTLAGLVELIQKIRSGKISSKPQQTTQNAINITVDVSDQIGRVVGDAVHDAALSVGSLVSDLVGGVTSAVNSFAGSVGSFLGELLSSLKDKFLDIAKWVAGHAASIVDYLAKNIGDVIEKLAKSLYEIITQVASVVEKVAMQIQEINDKFIQPIANIVNTTLQTISALTIAIERDLHAGLQGILQIPSDIAGALGSIDATMQRTVEQIGTLNKRTATDVFLKYPNRPLTAHLEDMNNTLEQITKGGKISTTFHDSVNLTDSCRLPGLIARIEKMIPKDSVIPDIARGLGDALLNVLSVVALLHGEFSVVEECGDETVMREFPIKKLSPGDALQALRRGFITEEQATEELLVQGINKSRMNVMLDLGKQLLPVDTLIDMWYRGIIDDQDRDQGMLDMAYTGKQISALMRESIRLIPPNTVLVLYQYGLITRGALDVVLHENRYSDAEIQATIDTLYRPAGGAEALDGLRNRTLIGKLNIQGLWTDAQIAGTIEILRKDIQSDGLPGHEDLAAYVRGSMTEGLDDTAIRARVYSIQNTLDVNTWFNLYFRGARTHSELVAVLARHGIPASLHEDLILSRRALIPFRTIPAMLAAGHISEPYAKQQLQAHGYDLVQTEALLSYALGRTKKARAETATQSHELSVATAKSFWLDGALSDDQYKSVLSSHGFDAATIDLTMRIESLAHHQKERKDNAQAIVDEALAGLITHDQAMARLSNENYTPVEISKYAKKLITTKRVASKLPSESELHQMLSHGVIDLGIYREALSALGFSQVWVDAFSQLRGSSLA